MALSQVTHHGPVGLAPQPQVDRLPKLLSILQNSDLNELSAMSKCFGDAVYFARIGALLICARVVWLISVDDFKCDDPLRVAGRSNIFLRILKTEKAQRHLAGKNH